MKYSKKKFSCLREQESRCFDEMWMKAMAGKDDKRWSLETMWPQCYDNFLLLLHWRQSNDLATVADDSNTMCACSNAETTAFLESALQTNVNAVSDTNGMERHHVSAAPSSSAAAGWHVTVNRCNTCCCSGWTNSHSSRGWKRTQTLSSFSQTSSKFQFFCCAFYWKLSSCVNEKFDELPTRVIYLKSSSFVVSTQYKDDQRDLADVG